MIFLVDAQLPPTIATWISEQGHAAHAVRDIGMRDSPDAEIWNWAQENSAIIVTKDEDFAILASLHSPPPQILWVRIGNSTNANLRKRFAAVWPSVVALLQDGSAVVELR